MAKLLSTLFLLFTLTSVYAQQAAAEAPTETASPLTVILFLGLFVGSCLAYVGYIWWRRKKDTNVHK